MGRRFLILGFAVMGLQLLPEHSRAQTRYPAERDHSPITRQVAERLRDIVTNSVGQGKSDNRFIKVGDSITVAPSYFMGQFNSPDYTLGAGGVTRDLDSYEYLRPSMEYYLTGIIPGVGTTSFGRESLAAQVGQTASWAVSGDPSPLDQEIAAVQPTFAVIMYGTNDIGWWEDDHYVMSWILQHLSEIAGECISEGVVPILKAPPPRVGYELKMLTLSHLIRALAQAWQIPFVDYHRAMMPLPDLGLGGDGMHPSVYQWNWMCHLTPAGLQYGNNMNNLVAMQALDRSLRVAVEGVPSLDFEPPALAGSGTQGAPFQVDELPFIDTGTTTPGTPDTYYALALTESTQLRFMLTYQGFTDLDLVVLDDTLTPIHEDDGQIDVTLGAGQYFVRIETADGLPANAGDFQMLIMDRTTTGVPSSDGIFVDGGRAAPSQIDPSQPTGITFTVAALDDSAINGVSLDLSELGGGSAVAMSYAGDGIYSYTGSFTVAAEGEKLITVTAADDGANQASIPIWVMVGDPPATLTVVKNEVAEGAGTVSSAPPGIDCGSDCSEIYPYDTAVTLTAQAEAGTNFAGWSGSCTGPDPECDLAMTDNRLVTATFEPVGHTYALTVSKDGNGDGTVTSVPAGIDCGGDCSEEFPSGTGVTLSASAGGESTFAGWSGACSGTGTCVVTMSQERSVTATFHSNTVPAVVIYDDALASGWQNWSWSATIDLEGESPTWDGSEHAVNATITAGWGAFSPAMPTGSVDTSVGYESVRFLVHGGSGADKAFAFATENDGGMSTVVQFTAVADTWTEITMTLEELGSPESISRLYFQNNSASPIGMVTFDYIRMVPNPVGIFTDGFESGDTLRWSATPD